MTNILVICMLIRKLRDSKIKCYPFSLKGSYDVVKNNIIWCSVKVKFQKILFSTYIFHIPHSHSTYYCCSSMPRFSEMLRFLQRSSFWAEYLKRETEMLRPLPHCDAVVRRDDAKTIKPIINEAFIASSGGIITDYKDLYGLIQTYALPCLHLRSEKQQKTSTTLHSSKLAFE